MHQLRALAIALCASSASAFLNGPRPGFEWPGNEFPTTEAADDGLRARHTKSRFLNEKSKKFSVNGTDIPNVNFDAGESYAGILPVNTSASAEEMQDMYFWFFPSETPPVQKEIVIWLTGGPGCSSIGELLQENGPISWKPGAYAPIRNPWSWHRLTNVVWVDQPVGTGFSRGPVTATDQHDVARQFMGFWRNFVDVFGLHGYKVFVAGSSYSGLFSPYISSAMLDARDTVHFDVKAMMIFDPLISQRGLSQDFGVSKTVEYWGPAFTLNETARAKVREMDEKCGYAEYLEKYFTFPPSGPQPVDLPGSYTPDMKYVPECDILTYVATAERAANPCFSYYNILRTCPLPFDPVGFTENSWYYPADDVVYFDRPDVKAAINAPADREWRFCSKKPVFVDDVDGSQTPGPGSLPLIPGIVERTGNVIIGHGLRDFILQSTGTLLSIQNMTWGGVQGFQVRPETTLNVPFHEKPVPEALAGAGELGVWHAERGLTYFETPMAGHFIGRDAPTVSFRALEVLLGRVKDLGSTAPFMTDIRRAGADPSGGEL
ncbi:carboxypeptidase [Colletotrichum plurivorum]|uniref:Carboxypeptidase n=1 Tax=Colletotrichum plurivorum TaxID=2175906 RepID=A0A8H6KJF8_9PEZI|nr:carboxypeptidase [Colletotrichum plurivorum]